MPYAISLKKVSKTFRDIPGKPLAALRDINLEIEKGEFFIFVGPSGCGKSTLLRIMSGLEKEYDGEASFGDGINKKDLSFVFQQFALLPWLTVYDNIEVGLLSKDISSEERRSIVNRETKRLGLQRFERSYPRDLSGGMRQRVGIARALATNPKIIFMDEPFSELDSFTAEELRKEILNIWEEQHTTIVMVTHLIPDAFELGDRIAILTPRPATIEKIITNKVPRPRNLRSQEFYKTEDEIYKLIKP